MRARRPPSAVIAGESSCIESRKIIIIKTRPDLKHAFIAVYEHGRRLLYTYVHHLRRESYNLYTYTLSAIISHIYTEVPYFTKLPILH